MVFHFHQYVLSLPCRWDGPPLTSRSQGFDRGARDGDWLQGKEWKLTDLKKVFTPWQVEMEQHGGWNSN
jgi:hypothetical protein